MDCEFHLQDPTSPDTVYLFEAIIGASRGAATCTGMFAFASRAGVDSLIGDPETQHFLGESTMSLLVGIDAVTNRHTLERLQELEQEHESLSVQVFWNPTNALFHPKVARFEYPDGRRSMIVGSGNLTPGGLRQNFEAFSVIRAAPDESLENSVRRRFALRVWWHCLCRVFLLDYDHRMCHVIFPRHDGKTRLYYRNNILDSPSRGMP